MQETFYTITNKESGETKDVVLHTAGDGYVLFAEPQVTSEAWQAAETFRFENPNKDDDSLTSEAWTIAKK